MKTSKTRIAVRTANRVRGHVGHGDLTLVSYGFDALGFYRCQYVDNQDISAAGVKAEWAALADAGGLIAITRMPRAHSEVV